MLSPIEEQEEPKVVELNEKQLAQIGDDVRSMKQELNKVVSKILTAVNVLQEEHRIFKRPFILNGMDYLEELRGEIS